mgnify:CR=1 FL=1
MSGKTARVKKLKSPAELYYSIKDGVRKKVRTNFIQQGSFDVVFACIVLLLFTVGIIAMYSASYAYASYNKGDANEFFKSQLGNAVIGFVAMAFSW